MYWVFFKAPKEEAKSITENFTFNYKKTKKFFLSLAKKDF